MAVKHFLVIVLFPTLWVLHAIEPVSDGDIVIEKPVVPEKITPELSRDIIARLTDKYSKMYDKYAGCESTRYLEVKWYKPGTMELVKSEKVAYTRWDDFYEDLEYKTLSYEVDGKPDDPDDYDPHETKPGIPVFDRNGEKEYLRSVIGVDTVKGEPAYKIQVIPRRPKNEHFKGFIWATVSKLDLVQFQGTAGKFRIGLQELSVFFEAKDFGGYYCFTAGHNEARIAFFIFQPERILHFKWYATDFKPMPKKAGK